MVMKPIKVNADYEAVLFGHKSLPVINEAIEFLAFFLEMRPLYTKKKYSSTYLNHVEHFTGRKPQIVQEGTFENWWGPLVDRELEKKLNSKEMSARLSKERGWCSDTYILTYLDDLPVLDKAYLAKNPYGMSGQNFSMVSSERLSQLEVMLKNGKVILEPFLARKYDFSHYIFPNGIRICYQNLVDKKFQYKGSIFQDYTRPEITQLPFYSIVDADEWESFQFILDEIVACYQGQMSGGFSIDSFIYQENGKNKIRALSEVNYRRTMGQVAFELSLKFGGLRKWSRLVLIKSLGLDFLELKNKLAPIEWSPENSRGVILLSPGDTRYDMLFLSAFDASEGNELIRELEHLLPDGEFTIEF
jgi:hypothetical protein